jgi:Ca2+-binding RTX toxin-like protein
MCNYRNRKSLRLSCWWDAIIRKLITPSGSYHGAARSRFSESLEGRCLLAACVINGDQDFADEADTIQIEMIGTDDLRYWLNGAEAFCFDVTTLNVNGVGGDDSITFDVNATTPTFATTLSGGAGDDVIQGGSGNETLQGDGGNDTYVFSGTSNLGADRVVEAANADRDTLDFTNFGQAANVNLGSGSAQTVSTGKLTLTLSSVSGLEDVRGSALGENITGNSRNNDLRGGDGNDNIIGNFGDDTVYGEGGSDTIYGDYSSGYGSGNDSIYGGDGSDTIYGDGYGYGPAVFATTGNDTIYGDDGDDSIWGDAHGYGGYGNDMISGGLGTDRLDGQSGNDTYVFDDSGNDRAAGTDTVVDVDGTDTLDFSNFFAAVTVNLSLTTAQTVGTGPLEINAQIIQLSSGLAIENVIGSGEADTITGNGLGNKIYGNAGNDTIGGGTGNDSIWGDGGDDSMTGGGGSDFYVFDNNTRAADGADTVVEAANLDTDTLDFSQYNAGVYVDLNTTTRFNVVAGGSLSLSLSSALGVENVRGSASDDLIHGNDRANSVLGNAGNDTIFGGNGNDTMTGGAGSDSMSGEAGDDTFSALDGEVDIIDGGAGTADKVLSKDTGAVLDVVANCEL